MNEHLKTVIMVNSNASVSDVLADMLEIEKYQVERYANPLIVLDFLRTIPTESNFGAPNILFSGGSFNTVGLNGVNFLRRVRRLHPKLPLVIVSGEVDDVIERAVFDLDLIAAIETPFHYAQIREVLKQTNEWLPRI